MGSGINNLEFVNNKVLAQARQTAFSGRDAQILQRSLKEFFICQYGKRSPACRFQFSRQLRGIKIRANQAARWRSLLQLRNDGNSRFARRPQRGAKPSREV